eukprot:tig00000411_g579.t1
MEGGEENAGGGGGRGGAQQAPDAGRSDRDQNWRRREDAAGGQAHGFRVDNADASAPAETADPTGDAHGPGYGTRGGFRGRGGYGYRGRGGYHQGDDSREGHNGYAGGHQDRGGFRGRGGYRGRGRGAESEEGGAPEGGYGYYRGRGGRGGYGAGRGQPEGEGESEYGGGRGRGAEKLAGGYRGRGGEFRGRGGRGGYGRGGGRPPADGSIPEGHIFAFVLVSRTKIGLVKGKSSERILALQDRTRTLIRCPTEDGYREGALYEERMTKVIGPPSGVERAVMEILHIIGEEASAVKFAIQGDSTVGEEELRACLEGNGLAGDRVKTTVTASTLGASPEDPGQEVRQTTVDLEGRGYDLQKALALVACAMHFLEETRAGAGPVVRQASGPGRPLLHPHLPALLTRPPTLWQVVVPGAAMGMLLGQRARELHDVEGRATPGAAPGCTCCTRHIEDRGPHVLRSLPARPAASAPAPEAALERLSVNPADEAESSLRAALSEALASIAPDFKTSLDFKQALISQTTLTLPLLLLLLLLAQGKLSLKARVGRVVFHSLPSEFARAASGLSGPALLEAARAKRLRHVFETGANPPDRRWLARLGLGGPGRGGARYAVSVEDAASRRRLRFRYEVETGGEGGGGGEDRVLLAITGDKVKKLLAFFCRSPEHLSSNNINLPFNDRRFRIASKRLKASQLRGSGTELLLRRGFCYRKTVYEEGDWTVAVTEADVRDTRQHRSVVMVTLQSKALSAALRGGPPPDREAVLALLPPFLAKARALADAIQRPGP